MIRWSTVLNVRAIGRADEWADGSFEQAVKQVDGRRESGLNVVECGGLHGRAGQLRGLFA